MFLSSSSRQAEHRIHGTSSTLFTFIGRLPGNALLLSSLVCKSAYTPMYIISSQATAAAVFRDQQRVNKSNRIARRQKIYSFRESKREAKSASSSEYCCRILCASVIKCEFFMRFSNCVRSNGRPVGQKIVTAKIVTTGK